MTATSWTRWAGPITASATTRTRSRIWSARSISSPRTRPSTTISATPIGASAAPWKPNSSGPMPAISSPSQKSCRRSKPRSRTACPMIPLRPRRPPPTRKKKTARAADRRGWSPMPALTDDGRAKVNLTLRVVGRRVDGYHDLESVVAFADCADRLSLAPGSKLALKTTGPRAGDCGETADNLVFKAAGLLRDRVPGLRLGEFTLDKMLPVAAGIGGGSADAAAALRLLAQANGL